MTDCVYFTVRSPEYRAMCAIAVISLRAIGRHRGDIIVFTNAIDDHLRSIADMALIYQHGWTCHGRDDRMYALRHLDRRAYQHVLALDADTMATADIAPLLQCDGHLLYYEEPWQTIRMHGHGDYYTMYMTHQEWWTQFGHLHTINNGQWTIPADLIERYDALYHQVYHAKPDRDQYGADQACMNAIIRRGLVPAKPYAPGLVAFPAIPSTRASTICLLHFAGVCREPEDRLRAMQAAVAELQP